MVIFFPTPPTTLVLSLYSSPYRFQLFLPFLCPFPPPSLPPCHRARGECQDGHLCCLLCSPLQHTDSHHHIPAAAGGRGLRHHGDSRHAPCPPLYTSPRHRGCPESSGEGQEPQDEVGVLRPPHFPCDSPPRGFGRPHGGGAAWTAVLSDVSGGELEGEWRCMFEYVCVCMHKCMHVCVHVCR